MAWKIVFETVEDAIRSARTDRRYGQRIAIVCATRRGYRKVALAEGQAARTCWRGAHLVCVVELDGTVTH